jgi:hypothetical protein
MGLDMYLYAEQWIPFRSWDKDEKDNEKFDKLAELTKLDDLIDKGQGYISAYAKVQIGYWRKVNAIHKYFVDNCAGGVDNCEEMVVERKILEKLRDICEELSLSKDVERAVELLPPTGGFFFGSTETDEWYFNGVEYTYNLLKKILEKIPEDDYNYEFIYRASW